MDDEQRRAVTVATTVADRLDSLADTADLMGDATGADRLRDQAAGHRRRAMELLDE